MSIGGYVAFSADEEVVASSHAQELEVRVRKLKRLFGRKTMEIEVLKEVLTAAREEARLAMAVRKGPRHD